MNTSAEKYFDRMIEILKNKQNLLREMFDLTQAQANVIKSETLSVLQKFIEEKQIRIDAIDKLDEEFSVYMERLKTTAKVKSLEELNASVYPAAAQLRGITGEILELIKKISDTEKINSSKSKELLNNLGGEIRKINQGKKVNKAYSPEPVNAPSYFVDKKK
jgi:uncharacterized protein YdiU (UPF0061 family)